MSDATIWEGPAASVPVVNADGNIFEETQLAAAAQTVFTLATFTYTPATHSIFVYKNGTMLRRGVDYTETANNKITLAIGALLNDKLTFIAYAIQQIIPPIVFNGLPAGGTAGQVLSKTTGSDYDAQWSDPSIQTSLLDAARQNIASASTVNLTALASTTRNIQITGSIQIDGFQVTNGQVWVARFAASLVLKNNANIVTQAGQDIKVSPGDTLLLRATADNVMEVIGYSRASASLQRNHNDFRLTLSTGVPVPTADTNSATLYCTPYCGNKISLFNGVAWVVRESAEFNLAIAGLTVSRPYDVFCYDNAGVPTLELLIWTSATVRATVLTTQDGVLVKSGDATRKYLGTVVPTAANQLTDFANQRLVWNYYNRVSRHLMRVDPTATWAYTTAVFRQANNNVSNRLDIICGVSEDSIDITATASVSNTNAGVLVQVGIGVNSTTVNSASYGSSGRTAVANVEVLMACIYRAQAIVGYTQYNWIEWSNAVGASTWVGSTSAGISGVWRC